ncbi:uncharacterized protein Dwil_GK15883 [Drosophila willistoni]|uniref:Uncharacterized protein n=1 Tax=Drosophila willistoni TaxID=7260 RepID=A0A0Q9WPT6_DROWI|nr:uncharacterized protein Dwil_GK15883 [Drosophila willistoni]
MRARKLNAQEREHLRRCRSETRLIVARCKERGFEYVVNPPEQPKVAFGTTMDREVMPTSGPFMDSYMRRNQPEERLGPGPFDYDYATPMGFKYPSKTGFSALVSKVARLPSTTELGVPPLGLYEAKVCEPKNIYTFAKTPKQKEPKWMTPGASTYSYHLKYPKWDVEMSFGTIRIIWPAVAVFCSANNTAKCNVCHQLPIGDYFHNFTTDKDMCRKCMNSLMNVIRRCDLQVVERYRKHRDMKQFVPARYCGFFHEHSGTAAAMEKTSRKQLRDKIRVENYLYRFVSKVE